MVNYADEALFIQDSVDKQLIIEWSGGSITNAELFSESLNLTESLCSESELRFGCCEASQIQFKVGNFVAPLIGEKITVSIVPHGGESFQIGEYWVESAKPTADKRWKDVVAYDAMHQIINADVIAWYNALTFPMTLKNFRDSFFTNLGITQETVTLPNDSMVIEKTIDAEKLSGKTVISCICEINGCFGHINRDGEFVYVYLNTISKALYPRNTLYPKNDLYPAGESGSTDVPKNRYISAEYEDYETALINKLQIRMEENDIGVIIGSGDNGYVIEDNFLVYGYSSSDLQPVAENIYLKIKNVKFRPANVVAKGNPCLEVGDAIRLVTRYEIVHTYILTRNLTGIQALKDVYTSESSEYQVEDVNSLHEQIIQLKGKSNVLTRTIEETQSEITDVAAGLSSRITQNATAISSEVTRATTAEGTLSSNITQTANAITSEVTRATTAEGNLSSRVTQTETAITTKVSIGNVSSEISQEAGQITISSNRLVVNATNFSLTADGKVTANNGVFRGALYLGFRDVLYASDNQGNYTQLMYYYNWAGSGVAFLEFLQDTVFDNDIRIDSGIRFGEYLTSAAYQYAYFTFSTSNHRMTEMPYVSDSQYTADDVDRYFRYKNTYFKNVGNTGYADVYGIFNSQSDIRYKKVHPEWIDPEISKEIILGIEPIAFEYTDDTSGYHRGFSAQQVKEVLDEIGLPEMVYSYNQKDDRYYMARDELVADLVNCVKDLYGQIAELKQEIASLREQIND